jgi:hypothetical protein
MLTFYFGTVWELVYEIVELLKPKQDKNVDFSWQKRLTTLYEGRAGYRVRTVKPSQTKMVGVSISKF